MRSRAALTKVEADIQKLVSVPQYVHRLLVPSGVSMLSSMLEARGQDLWGCPVPCLGSSSQCSLWL